MALQTPVELVPQTDTFDQWRQKTNNVIDQSNQTVLDVGDLTTLTTSTQDNIVDAINALNTDRTLTLTGDVAGNVTFDGEGAISLNTTIVHNAVLLGVDTVGEYVSGINSALRTIDVELCQPGTVFCVKLLTPGSGYNYPTTVAQFTAPDVVGGVTATADVVLSGAPVTSLILSYGGTGYFIGSTTISLSAPDKVGGTQATAALTLSGAPVQTLSLTNGGSGYTNASVAFSAPDVAGGTQATASLTFGGAPVTGLSLTNGGSGFTFGSPTVSISAPEKPGAINATASANLSGAPVTGLSLTNGGSGFTQGTAAVSLSAPQVAGGTQATATIALTGSQVLDVTMTNVGAAYTTANVVFSAPQVAGGVTATGTAVFSGAEVIGCYMGLIGGSGYHAADTTVTFSAPEKPGGITAQGFAKIVDGVITEIDITNKGSKYLNPPTVTIVDSHPVPGTGAVAIALIGKFNIEDVTITNPGSGYLTSPTVTITGDGVQAAAAATIGTSSVASITLQNAGSGYLTAPTVTITGGSDATASATIGTSSITSITITNAGTGYLSAPTVTIGGGTGATATATIGSFSVDSITLTNAGSGYLYPPTVTISGTGSNATATATIGGSTITSISLTNAGDGYLTAPTVTIGGVGVDAAAFTTIGTSTVTDIIITNGGSGYTTAPDLTIVDTAVVPGTDATALAVVSLETSKVNVELPPTGVTAGTYGLNTSAFKVPTFTVDTYGRVTNATEFTIPTTGVTAGSYGSENVIPTFNVDPYGRITLAGESEVVALNIAFGTFVENTEELNLARSSIVPSSSIFSNWARFSHDGSSNQPASAAELTAWSYNSATDRITSTTNSSTYIGFVSDKKYDNYLHEVVLSSDNADDDAIAVIIAYHVDPITGRQNTLSAIRSVGGVNLTWQIIYNYNRSDQQVIYDGNQFIKWGNGNYGATFSAAGYVTGNPNDLWSDYGTTGARVKITRTGNTILCQTSDLGETSYVAAANVTIDLTSNPVLNKFIPPSFYGYACLSQQNSTFQVLTFIGNNKVYDVRDGSVWNLINGTWVLSTTQTIWNEFGDRYLLNNQNNSKIYYTPNLSSVIKIVDSNIIEQVFGAGLSGTSITPNWNNGTVQTFTLSSNFTLNAPVNMPVGASMSLLFTQDSTGSRTMSSSSSYKFASGLKTLSTAPNAIDFINIFNVGGGVYLAALTRGYA
jgi:hypothetical protein